MEYNGKWLVKPWTNCKTFLSMSGQNAVEQVILELVGLSYNVQTNYNIGVNFRELL